MDFDIHTNASTARLQRLCNEGRLSETIALADALLAAGSSDLRVRYWRGAALFQAGDFQGALATFESAIEVDPSFTEGWRGKALCLADLGRDAEAIPVFREALRCRPDDPVTLDELGKSYTRLAQYAAAADTFRSAIELQPRHTTAWLHLAEVQQKSGDTAAAFKSIEESRRNDPANAEVWAGRGGLLLDLLLKSLDETSPQVIVEPDSVLREALRSFDRALELGPGNAGASHNRELALSIVKALSRSSRPAVRPS